MFHFSKERPSHVICIKRKLRALATLYMFSIFCFTTEECIFTVTPDPEDKVYLQTPNWYDGLPPHVTVSWNITVPRKQAAHLTFSKDRMGIACETGRAYVNIKEQKPRAEEIVRREDEPLPEPLDMYHHFWVNISNCKPVDKKLLSLQFRVTFMQRKTGEFLQVGLISSPLLLLYQEAITHFSLNTEILH